MSFSLDDVALLATNRPRVQELAPQLALTKKSIFADRALLEREFGEGAVSYTHLTLPTTPYV